MALYSYGRCRCGLDSHGLYGYGYIGMVPYSYTAYKAMAYVYITSMAYMVTAYVVLAYIGTAQDAYDVSMHGYRYGP